MTNLQQVIQKLKNSGKTDEEITLAVESLTKLALVRYTKVLMDTLEQNQDSEEVKAIEELTDDTEREKRMKEFYEKTTGLKMDDLINSKLEEIAAEFLKQ